MREADNRSLAEKIMSIPFQHKIGILCRITPPIPQILREKGRTTIIAIEGDDSGAAKSLTDWLEESLSRETDIVVKVIDGPKPSEVSEGDELQVPDMFKTVIEWHAKNKELLDLVQQDNGERQDSAKTKSTTNDTKHQGDSDDHAEDTIETEVSMTDVDEKSASGSNPSRTVVLFRTYTLSASNHYASGIPIKDVYRPDDHWQWTATLWRGIAGPDLTIYVRDVDTPGSSRDEPGKGGVEIVEETKTNSKFMAIRRSRVAESKNGKGGLEGVEAGTLRRLGFEVGEWVRSAITGRHNSD